MNEKRKELSAHRYTQRRPGGTFVSHLYQEGFKTKL